MSAAFENRLQKNLARLRRLKLPCFRVYDRDLPDVPLALDLYEDHLHAIVFEPRHGIEQARVDAWMTAATRVTGIAAPAVKRRGRGDERDKLADTGARFIAREGGLRFWVNLTDYADTGLFLDHRVTRDLVRREAAGKRVLNLFAYTGAFSVYAAAGGAHSTVSVDLSPTYARWAEDNLALNGFTGDVVVADALAWLAHTRERFDVIVLDPPTVSKSKRAEPFEIQRDHERVIASACARLTEGGVIFFSTNFQQFALGDVKASFVDEITAKTVPPDFSRRPPIHRAWRIGK